MGNITTAKMLDQDPLLGDDDSPRQSSSLFPNKRSFIRVLQSSPNTVVGILFVGALVLCGLLAFVAIWVSSPTTASPQPQSNADFSKQIIHNGSIDISVPMPVLKSSVNNITSGTWVTLGWQGVPEDWILHGSGDYICTQDSFCDDVTNVNMWVGVFGEFDDVTTIGPQAWPTGNPPWLATSPIKWKPFNTTVGEMSFYLESNRENIRFHMFSNGTTYPILQTSSDVIVFSDLALPYGVHIARSWASQDMRVMWQQMTVDRSAKVRWGTTSLHYNTNTSAISATYVRAELCGPPATTHGWKDPGIFYSAILEDLQPGTTVYYVVGSDDSGWTQEYSFKAPVPSSADQELHVSVIADLGETYIDGAQYHWMEPYAINTTNGIIIAWDKPFDTQDVKRLALNPHKYPGTLSGRMSPPHGRSLHHIASRLRVRGLEQTDVVLHIGDIAYATGYSTEWDRFMRQIEPIASRLPYMTGQGNHERDYPQSGDLFGGGDSGGECGVPTSTRFIMPTPSHKQDSAWYSFNQGPVHFLMLDTEMAWGPGSSQYDFFARDLAAVNRTVTPWIIVMGHRPMYWNNVTYTELQVLEPLLLQHKVDLCLWGHVHNALVTCPVYNGECVKASQPGDYDAPVHAVVGNAGQSLSPFPETRAPWSVYQAFQFGYSTIDVKGSTLLTMRFYRDSDDGLDYEFNITRRALWG